MESYAYNSYKPGVRVIESRPTMSREASYSHSTANAAKPFKIKTSKAYGEDDVQYSSYPRQGFAYA
jgi:hypothetical protein